MSNIRPIITAYCLDWHITTSSAFMELLVKPLAPYAEIKLTAWDGKQELPAPQPDEITIFCQLPPTENWLAQYSSPVVWIPMADAIFYPPNMKQHPAVKVVAFSKSVEKMAQDLGLPYLRLQYFVNPDLFPPASFDGERVLLYWNRTGLFHKRFLLRLCKELKVNRLIFRSAIDPRIEKNNYYELPPKIGTITIETHPTLTSYDAYLGLLKQANIFIAPRRVEGVGIALLEAMASGCCVLAYDDITMNEYISHGQNGLLFAVINRDAYRIQQLHHLLYRVLNKFSWKLRNKPMQYPQLTTFQNWRFVRQADVKQLGENARQTMRDGYKKWVACMNEYAKFLTNWD